MDETKAIRLCVKDRDPAGFDYLVAQFREQAYRHAYGFLGNREDALDACQDAFRKAFLGLPKLEKLDRFYPWFYCILRNHCFNTMSRRRTEAKKRPDLELEAESMDCQSPSKEIEKSEDAALTHRALAALKPEFQEILVLKYFSECSYQQIAETIGISRGTVMSRLYYARCAFRAAIEAQAAIDQQGFSR